MTDCTCGTDAASLNPAEKVVHRADAPCSRKPSIREGYAWLARYAHVLGDAPHTVTVGRYDVMIQGEPGSLTQIIAHLGLSPDADMNGFVRNGSQWWRGTVDGIDVRAVES